MFSFEHSSADFGVQNGISSAPEYGFTANKLRRRVSIMFRLPFILQESLDSYYCQRCRRSCAWSVQGRFVCLAIVFGRYLGTRERECLSQWSYWCWCFNSCCRCFWLFWRRGCDNLWANEVLMPLVEHSLRMYQRSVSWHRVGLLRDSCMDFQ